MLRKSDPRIAELAEVPLFSACTRRELAYIAGLTDEVRIPAGSVLMREGTAGRECFVLADGEAVVTIKGEEIARLGAGDIVGEMALLDHGARSATVEADAPIRAFVLTTLQFAAVADECPSVARKVMSTLAQRLRSIQAA